MTTVTLYTGGLVSHRRMRMAAECLTMCVWWPMMGAELRTAQLL